MICKSKATWHIMLIAIHCRDVNIYYGQKSQEQEQNANVNCHGVLAISRID